jgi:alpha-tubulin suppressor-like RCC1 family protein
LGIPGGNRSSPTQIGNGSDWSVIFAGKGNYHSGGVKTNGTLWTWGYNAFGQLGLGDLNNRNTPTLLGE